MERYGQLTYTSVDSDGAAGGWRVKETTGGITSEEVRLLVSRIQLALSPIEQLPAYPTPDQIQAAPRRLAYRRIDESTAAFFHYVPAGLDSMGRPGNVFAHVVLDRDAAQTKSTPRPIELWRSPQWLTPYGGPAVSAAVLPAEVPGPGGVVTAEGVVGFVCDAGIWRLGTLCGLLDGVAAALDGGPAVVLGVESADAAAQWIGAVSFLMSPGTARRFNFCISDCGLDLEYLLRVGHHLIGVPRTDLGCIRPDTLAIDEAETLYLGELNGQGHRTAAGHDIRATAWSAMAQVVLVDPSSAAQLLTDIDEFASHAVDVDLPAALPMAVAVLNREQWHDAVPEATSVVARANGTARTRWRR
jgi:hypothetical protein